MDDNKIYLDKEGLKYLLILLEIIFSTKIDINKLKPLTIDDYNNLGDNIDNEAFYFIIDSDDDIFNKIKELEDKVKESENFIKQFPEDNRTYGIINRYPKYLNIPGLDNDPRDDNTDGQEQ